LTGDRDNVRQPALAGRLAAPSTFYAALSLFSVLGAFLAIKWFFIALDVADPEILFRRPTIPPDEFSMYVAHMAIFDNRTYLDRQPWYVYLKENAVFEDLRWRFGYAGFKLAYPLTHTGAYVGLKLYASAVRSLTGLSYDDIFRLYQVVMVGLTAVKYLLLRRFVFRGYDAWPLLSGLLFLDLYPRLGLPPFLGSGLGHLFATAAYTVWIFGEGSLRLRLAYGLLVAAAVMSMQYLVPLAAMAAVDGGRALLPRLYQRVGEPLHRHFLVVLLGMAVVYHVGAALFLVSSVVNEPSYYPTALTFFFKSTADYGALANLAAIVLLAVATRQCDFQSLNARVRLAVVGMTACTFGLLALGIAGVPAYLANADRPVHFAAMVAIMGVARAWRPQASKSSGSDSGVESRPMLLVAAVVVLASVQPLAYSMAPGFAVDDPSWYPKRMVTSDGVAYYVADQPEQVHRYFWMERFRDAPLVFDAETPRYSKATALSLISKAP
jgi:hypothetical protein